MIYNVSIYYVMLNCYQNIFLINLFKEKKEKDQLKTQGQKINLGSC